MKITYAEEKDIAAIAVAEAACFPSAEAATEQEFVERIKYYGNHFWLLYDADKLIAFVDGFVTDEPDLTDAMYENACMHNENGAWQMIFGVNTLPEYRKRGYAGELILSLIHILLPKLIENPDSFSKQIELTDKAKSNYRGKNRQVSGETCRF